MEALLMPLKQLNCICIYGYLWLAAFAVVNAEVILQPKPSEIGTEKTGKINVSPPRGTATTPALTSETMEVAALGRPLFPGMLYDCRSDSFISGVTLWDKKSLSDDLDSHPHPQANLKFSSSDSLSSKFNLLDVSTSLKTSFLGGLVEVGGSGKFLRDTKSSKQQTRVTIFYSETTRYEQLTMSQLGQITYPEVFDQKTATHVVVGVLYGAQAFMVFDRMISEEEKKQEIQGELNSIVRSIPSYSIEGEGSVNMKEDEKKKADKIGCTFHCDVYLQQNPTTYMEALDLYKQLPSLLKNPENEVPIKVWLYPLHLMNATAARVEREISTSVTFETESIIEELGKAEKTYKDLSGNAMVNNFRDIKERLRSFQDSFSSYKTMLLKAVGRVLPAVRGGEMEESSLEDILQIHRSSPFNAEMMNQWFNDAKSELHILCSLTKSLDRIKIEDSDSLNSILLNPDFPVVICLTFTSLKYEDPYLSALKEYLKTDRFKELDGEHNMVSVESIRKWFNDSDLIGKMRFNISLFKGLSKLFKGHKVLFIISAISDPYNPGSSISLYEHGQLNNNKAQKAFRMLSGLGY